MSMAAWCSRNAAAFTHPPSLLRVELTKERRNLLTLSDRGKSENRLPVITILAPVIVLGYTITGQKNFLRSFV